LLVADAGIWIRALVDEEPGGPVRSRLAGHIWVAAPALVDLEFTNVLRGLVIKKYIRAKGAEQALGEFRRAPIQRYSHQALLTRVWQLRQNLTAYDAAYVALAERLLVDLLTVDHRVAGAPGLRCHVEVI
jgi:predicted nucleic acid-binding protein